MISIQSVACVSGNDGSLTEAKGNSNVNNKVPFSGLHSSFLSPSFSPASEKKIVVMIPGRRSSRGRKIEGGSGLGEEIYAIWRKI